MRTAVIQKTKNEAETYVENILKMNPGLNNRNCARKGDFNRFKQILEEMRDQILTEARYVLEGVKNIEISICSDEVDQVNDCEDQAFRFGLYDRNSRLLRKIEEAMERIEDGTYGICEECGEPIPRKRLKVRPVTTRCIDCKETQESMEKRFVDRVDRQDLFLQSRWEDRYN